MKTVRFGGPTDPFSRAAADPSSFGNLAIARGWVTPEDLEHALEIQRQQVPKLGQIMVDSGMLSDEQRDELVFDQMRRRGQKIPTDDLREFERRKLRRRLEGLKAGFREATKHAHDLAQDIHGLTGQPLDSSE